MAKEGKNAPRHPTANGNFWSREKSIRSSGRAEKNEGKVRRGRSRQDYVRNLAGEKDLLRQFRSNMCINRG